MSLTLEEQERAAYQRGDYAAAELLARADDAERALDDDDPLADFDCLSCDDRATELKDFASTVIKSVDESVVAAICGAFKRAEEKSAAFYLSSRQTT